MSDSDDDLVLNNLRFPRENTVIQTHASNVDNSNTTSYSFRSNIMAPNNMPGRYFDQTSTYSGRIRSPVSLRSFPNSRMNYHPYYRSAMSSQGSVYNTRCRSPMSVRSIDSNASVSVVDIALTLKNTVFNEDECRLINDAINTYNKNYHVFKRIKRRRNLKSQQNITHYDRYTAVSQSTERYNDIQLNEYNDRRTEIPLDVTQNKQQQNASIYTLNKRFANGVSFLLPSQRFNKTLANSTIDEISYNEKLRHDQQKILAFNNGYESNSDNEEIFSQSTRTNITQRKRALDTEDVNYSERKRNKTATSMSPYLNNITNIDFHFKKPQLPTKKRYKGKSGPEILITKSINPLERNLESFSNHLKQTPEIVTNLEETKEQHAKELSQSEMDTANNNTLNENTQNSSDVSMKPSIMKRRLFTQNLDFVESKNLSSDNLSSPQTKTVAECKEKNKVRKLVTSQSCLSRDVLGDNNVLDLIHKIVPPDQMNITNKKRIDKNRQDVNDKWDVSSVISMCQNDDVSDTYTDEEIFSVSKDTNKNGKQILNNNDPKPTGNNKYNNETQHKQHTTTSQCKVVLEKLPENFNLSKDKTEKEARPKKKCPVNLFWDTDSSDIDDQTDLSGQMDFRESVLNIMHPKKNNTRAPILNVRNFGNRLVNSSKSSKPSQDENVKVPNNLQTNNDERNNRTCSKSKCKEICIADTSMQKFKNTRSIAKQVNELEKSKIEDTVNQREVSNNDVQNRSTRSRSKRKETYVEMHHLKNCENKPKQTKNQAKVRKVNTVKNKENNSEMQNRSTSFQSKHKEAHIDMQMQNSNITTSGLRQVSKQKKLKGPDIMYVNKENKDDTLNRSTRSQAKQDNLRKENLKNKNGTQHVNKNERPKQKQKSSSSIKKNKSPELNSSRQSLRLKQKKNVTNNTNNLTPIKVNHSKSSNINTKLNISRESIRLKQKREARLFSHNTNIKL